MYELEILGQEVPKKLLLNAYTEGSISHSYLFIGPSGTGKFTMARWFAALLNCKDRVIKTQPNPCGTCSSCRKIHSSQKLEHINHPDIRIISPDPETHNIKIEQIRDLQKEAYYLPFESNWKIYIINGAHRMLDSAANCFLKILEEPPSRVVNILTSNNLYTLLPTIISRCQIIKFIPVEPHIVANFLTEREKIPNEQSLVYAHISQGSVGKALDLCRKEGLWDLREKVLDVLVILPSILTSELLLIIDKFSRDREEVELIIEIVLNWLRDLMFVKEKEDFTSLINVDRIAQIQSQSSQLTLWQIMSCISYTKEAQIHLKTLVSPGFVLQRLFVGMNRIQSASSSV